MDVGVATLTGWPVAVGGVARDCGRCQTSSGGGAGRVPAALVGPASGRASSPGVLGGPGLGLGVEEPLAPPAADEAARTEQAALGRDDVAFLLAETEERDGRHVVDPVGGAVLAPGWCGMHSARPLGRALRSGTLDAWYVEGLRERAPDAPLQPLLARAQAAGFAGLGLGAVAGGLLPGLVPGNAPGAPFMGRTVYDVSYAAGFLVTLGVLAYTVLLIQEPPRPLGAGAALRVARAVPETIRDGARLAISDPALRLLLFALALMLFATNPVEVLWPTVIQTMLAPERAAAAVGLLSAVYFLAIALGAHVADRIGRRVEGRDATMLGTVLTGLVLCQIALAWQGTLWGFAGAFLAFSVMLGLAESPAASLLHAHSPDDRRSTVLSVQSLMKQLGAMAGLLVLGGIGERTGVPAAWTAGAAALGVAAILAFALSSRLHR